MQETPQALGTKPTVTRDQPAPAYLECPVVVDGVVIASIADHSRYEMAGLSDIFPLSSSPAPSSANSSRFSIDGTHLESISDNLRLSPKLRSHHKRTASSSSIPQRSKFANFGRSAPSRTHDANYETEQPGVPAGFRATPLQLPKLAIPKTDRLQPSSIIPVPTQPFRLPDSPPWGNQRRTEMSMFFHQRGRRRSSVEPGQGSGNANRSLRSPVGFTNSSRAAQFPASGDYIMSPEPPSPAGGDTSQRSRPFTRRLMGSIFNRKPSVSDGQTPATETRISPVSPLSAASAVGRSASWPASPTDTEANAPRMCHVCEDNHPAKHFPRTTSQCLHPLDTCRACVAAWIAASMDGDDPDRILCPDSTCGKTLEHADIARLTPADIFEPSDAPTLPRECSAGACGPSAGPDSCTYPGRTTSVLT
jgi:hypothetical protein